MASASSAPLKVGVLISGRGSNLQALIAVCAATGFPAQIACVISNKADAKGLDHARKANIPAFVVSHKDYADKAGFEAAMEAVLERHQVQLVCLAGFMRLLSAGFAERWRDRVINIHPSLLPAFPGLDVHEKVLAYGVKLTGCTVHFVRAEMDHGPIIVQAAVPVLADDTEETLAARVLQAEHKAYPAALRLIAEGRVNIIDERTFIADAAIAGEAFFSPKVR
ncbi:MAG: phosphoribosylglycinamide formyltransferase [Alphaproteobacteria bacterium]|nr:phosphoribosylglycinamide formyltransferase [Alphaproteobacteria bacterium]